MTPPNTKSKTKGCIYYTDSHFDFDDNDPVKKMAWESIWKSVHEVREGEDALPIACQFREEGQKKSYPQMIRQIIRALRSLGTEYVFFCEHDVIYNPTHFEFTPERDDIFYYNENVWRWDYPKDRYFTYDRLISLSALCCNRQLALDHFKKRLAKIQELGEDKPHRGEPGWLRKMGYEPGTKQPKRGGYWTDEFETWRSEKPLIDIRHDKTFSPRKVNLEDFKHQPTGWKEQSERP